MFRPSTRARYALRAMIELSLREGAGPVSLREIARAQRLSPKYLEQLTIPLNRAGLVQAERGPAGGYRLARLADQITAREIVEAVDAPLYLLDCLRTSEACDRAGACAAQRLWSRVAQAVVSVLSETTLADLREDQRAATAGVALCYRI